MTETDRFPVLSELEMPENRTGEIFLPLKDGTEIPVAVIAGQKPGKTILITAGMHPDEYVGIEAAVELARELDPDRVRGKILIVMAAGRTAFEDRDVRAGVDESQNLYLVFPGKADGTPVERHADAIVSQCFPGVDYMVDLHSGCMFESLTPHVYYAGKADPAVMEQSREMARQMDVPYMVRSGVSRGGAYNYASSCGIPAVLLERGGQGSRTEEEVYSDKRDIYNLLIRLGIYEAQKEDRTYYPLDVDKLVLQYAEYTGLWYPEKKPGDLFERGEILGNVKDYSGEILETCYASHDGVVLYQTETLAIGENTPMIAYGRIAKEKDDREERIVSYWSKRSAGFLEQKRRELHNPIADRWVTQLNRYLPEKHEGKVLDVGCGAGFFSILLSRMGYEVTGIDLTPGMIEGAEKLAREERAVCRFEVGDAMKTGFPDGSFDVVVSRNLTWTLPDPEQAYREWLRVLKPGGLLLNFDANYGLDNALDLAAVPKNHTHMQLGMSTLQENEAIKETLPINGYARPAWDLEILRRLGIGEFRIDASAGKQIYICEDEFYNPAPVFALCVRKPPE